MLLHLNIDCDLGPALKGCFLMNYKLIFLCCFPLRPVAFIYAVICAGGRVGHFLVREDTIKFQSIACRAFAGVCRLLASRNVLSLLLGVCYFRRYERFCVDHRVYHHCTMSRSRARAFGKGVVECLRIADFIEFPHAQCEFPFSDFIKVHPV